LADIPVFNRADLRKVISTNQIEKMLSLFFARVPSVLSFQANNRGKNNQVYQINTTQGSFIAHILNPSTNVGYPRTTEDLAYVFSFQDAAEMSGVPLPQRYQTLSGQDYAQFELLGNPYYLSLQQFVAGRSLSRFNRSQWLEIAATMGQLHNAVKGLSLSVPPSRSWSIDGYIEQYELSKPVPALLLSAIEEGQYFNNYFEEFDKVLREARRHVSAELNSLTKYPIHGDINGNNLLFQQNRLVAVLDFDNCHQDYFCEDLSVPLLNHSTFTDHKLVQRTASRFLNRYSQINYLSQAELELSLYCWLAFLAWYSSLILTNGLKAANNRGGFQRLKDNTQISVEKLRAVLKVVESGI
jgi:Ser/Thr protein kinase RdoA (MazF antagonist)